MPPTKVQSWIDCEKALNHACGTLSPPERREALRDELDLALRRRGVAVEPVAATADERITVADGEIQIWVFTPAGAGPHPVFVHLHRG